MKKKIERLEIEYKTSKQILETERDLYNKADDNHYDCVEAQEILQAIAQNVQQQVHTRISDVVSRCLAAVFDDPYEFHIEFVRKRGQTEAVLCLKRDGLVIEDPTEATGGGVIDVAAFALRLAALLLSRPPRRRFVVLDEPFKFVHPPERRPRIVQMLEMLASEFDMQFLIVTGVDELQCGKVTHLQ